LYLFAFGKASVALEADPVKSTSQRAATRSRPFTVALEISLNPFPPEPMAARLSWSLGAVYPLPPKTCRGTKKNEEAAAVVFMKSLRVSEAGFLGFVFVIAVCLPSILLKEDILFELSFLPVGPGKKDQ
jgi:hypothetical protein